MFRYAKIAWDSLLQASVAHLISHYGITMGVLVLDDSDKMRSRNTSKIAGVHKVKDKKTGGWFMGQEFVFLSWCPNTVTIPVGFRLLSPDPALKTWRKINRKEKKSGIPLRERTKKSKPNPHYPSKKALALQLLAKFAEDHPEIQIQCVLADALYGGCLIEHINSAALIDGISQIVNADEPKSEFEKFRELMEASLPDRKSSKHMAGRDIGRLAPTPSLKYQKAA